MWNLAPIYSGVAGAILTVVVGYGVSLLAGPKKNREELRGLLDRRSDRRTPR